MAKQNILYCVSWTKKYEKVKLTPCVPSGANLRVKEFFFLFSLDETNNTK